MLYTSNYNLKKPEITDQAKITDINYNFDNVDSIIKTNANNITGLIAGTTKAGDANLLGGRNGAYYLNWANITNKPDPKITLAGDATGSVTLTDVGSGTLTVVIVDDSHNHIIGNVDGLQSALNLLAPLAGPTFTGIPTAPTAIAGTNTTQLATTAFVTTAVANKTSITGNAATATTLKTARTISLAGDAAGSVAFNGSQDVSITVEIADDSHNHIIGNIDQLQTELDLKAPLASPALTGTPTAPTATAGTNTTQVATTAFVTTAISSATNFTQVTISSWKITQDATSGSLKFIYG